MLIRKNTKLFKTILEIVSACRDRPDRGELIRLYITKAGDSVRERISVAGIQGEAGLFYEMNYQTVLGNLKSPTHQLHHSDEIPGLYFFHSSSNKAWDETPFEFDEAIKKEFASLPELPVFRKKEKGEKFVLPAPKAKGEAPKKKPDHKGPKGEVTKSARVVAMWPKQPDYRLRHDIHFTGLERVILRQAPLTKRDVLDYYHKIAEYILPYLRDRPQSIRLQRDGHQGPENTTLESLIQNSAEEVPEWIRTSPVKRGKNQERVILCNDREHLLFYVQAGCVEFRAGHARIKSPDSPDYLILVVESAEYELAKAIDVALAAREVLTGLRLPSYIKTDGTSALHIYIPLDSRSGFESARRAAEYLCNLIRLKIPGVVALKGSGNHGYGKVSLDYLINAEGRGVIVPYSLAAQSGNVAAPLPWEEVSVGLQAEAFTHETIFKRLKQEGDPFEGMFRKKINADALLERLKEHYAFLF